MKQRRSELEKTVSPQEAKKATEQWERLEDAEMMTMLRQIHGGRKQGNEELSE